MVTKLLFKGAKLAGIFVNGICFTIPGWAEYDQFIDNTKYREARTYPVSYLDRYSEFVESSRDMMDQFSKRNAHAFDCVKNLNREFADLKELDIKIKEFLQYAYNVANIIRSLSEKYPSLISDFEVQWVDIAGYCGRKQRE